MESKSQLREPGINAAAEEAPFPAPEEERSENNPQAWLTVIGSFLVYFVAFGFMNSFGFFQNYYAQNDLSKSSPAIIALIGSMQLGLMYIIGPISGAVFDAYGHRVCLFRRVPLL